MILTVVLILAAAAAAVLALVFTGRRPTQAVRLFCPVHETVVEVDGDVCSATDDDRVIGSPSRCERDCLLGREADERRWSYAGVTR